MGALVDITNDRFETLVTNSACQQHQLIVVVVIIDSCNSVVGFHAHCTVFPFISSTAPFYPLIYKVKLNYDG